MAWIGAIAAIGGGLLANQSSRDAARASRFSPMGVGAPGYANWGGLAAQNNGFGGVEVRTSPQFDMQQRGMYEAGQAALGRYNQGVQNQLGSDFLRGSYAQNDLMQQGLFGNLFNQSQATTPYQQQDFMGGVNGGMLQNIDPTAMGNQYTNMLRQQAQPGEQQAANSMASRLFGSGRLGTTGGQGMMGELVNQQNQADLGRQIAGQQFGLQQGLMAQQGYDQARANQQGLMLNQFGANQQGQMNQFGIDQGMFGRMLDMYNSGSDMTQDRFGRAMQLFGGENAINQQNMGDFMGFLGGHQSNTQTMLDYARLSASGGQAQTTANANAAQMRNAGNQDMIAGFMRAMGSMNQNDDED
jgi:hypothetical protein